MSYQIDTAKLYVNTFIGDTLTSAPGGFTNVGTNNIYTVDSARYWYGDRSLKMVGGGSIAHNWTYQTPTNIASGDGRIEAIIDFDTFAGDRAGLVFRAWNNSGTHQSYAVMLRGGNSIRLSKFSGVSETVIATVTVPTLATDTKYRIIVLLNGSSIKATYHAINTNEPSTWLIDTTDATNDNTKLGIGAYGYIGNGNVVWFDNLIAYIKPALPYPSPANSIQERANVWATYKEKFVRWDGAVVRPDSDRDIVSEAPAYGLKMAAIMNDQTTFDLIEGYCYGTLERTNEGETDAPHLMCWLVDLEVNNDIDDTNWATDGDIDRAVALLWAHGKWGSAGTIDYLDRALDILSDLRTYSANSDNSMQFILPYDGLQGDASYRLNPSYLDPSAFRLFMQHDTGNETFWQQAIDGTYFIITDSTDNAGNLATTAGLPTEWLIYNTSTNAVESSSANDDEYKFNAFRVLFRVYWDYLFYGSSESSSWLTDQIDDFFDAEYTAETEIATEYEHDGTVKNQYNKEYFYWAARYALLVGGKANASTVYTAILDNAYTVSNGDAYYHALGYYDSFWNFIAQIEYEGDFINFGQEFTSERDAKITGQVLTTSDRAAKLTGSGGEENITDDRDAKITGQETDNDERDAKTSGQILVNDERDAKITGEADINSERDAKTFGQLSTSDERDAAVRGSEDDTDERSAHLYGQADTNSDRDAKLNGVSGTFDERDAKVSGIETLTDERDAKTTGISAVSSQISAKIHGVDTTNDERDAKITGSDDIQSERDAKIIGELSTNDERDAKLSGSVEANATRGAKIEGFSSLSSERSVKLIGSELAAAEIMAHLFGNILIVTDRDAKIIGFITTSSERSAKVTGVLSSAIKTRPMPMPPAYSGAVLY